MSGAADVSVDFKDLVERSPDIHVRERLQFTRTRKIDRFPIYISARRIGGDTKSKFQVIKEEGDINLMFVCVCHRLEKNSARNGF